MSVVIQPTPNTHHGHHVGLGLGSVRTRSDRSSRSRTGKRRRLGSEGCPESMETSSSHPPNRERAELIDEDDRLSHSDPTSSDQQEEDDSEHLTSDYHPSRSSSRPSSPAIINSSHPQLIIIDGRLILDSRKPQPRPSCLSSDLNQPLVLGGSNETKGKKKYVCQWDGCQKSYTKPIRLEEHIRSHTNEVSLLILFSPSPQPSNAGTQIRSALSFSFHSDHSVVPLVLQPIDGRPI